MKTIAIELLEWRNCRPTMLIVVNRAIRNLSNGYTSTGHADNVILDAVESVINKMNANCDLQMDPETIYQKTWELAEKVARDKDLLNPIY